MRCSHCGQAIKKKDMTCPNCQSAVTPNLATTQFAAVNLLEGILLLLMGVMVLAVSAIFFLSSMGTGLSAIGSVSQAGDLWTALWQTEAGVYNISGLLKFLSCILWGCSGLFFILSAMISFWGGKGFGLVLTAECFMLAGFAAGITFYMIGQFQTNPSSDIWNAFMQVLASDWPFLLIQLVFAVITTVLCFLKRGAKRLLTRLNPEREIPIGLEAPATPSAATSAAANQATSRPSFQLSQDTATIYHRRASHHADSATHPDTPTKNTSE